MTKSILSILFIGAAIMLFVLYVQPTYDSVQQDRVKLTRFDEALVKTREIQELRSSLTDRFKNIPEGQITRLRKMLPDNVDNVRLVLDMDGIASQYGIRIQSVSVQESKEDGENSESTVLNGGNSQNFPYQSLTLQFEVISTYNDFILLLRDLESSLRIVDLISLSVKPRTDNTESDNTNKKPLYTFGVSLRTYWLQ